MSQSRWAKSDVGQFEIMEMQCEKCIYKLANPMVCKQFSDRKPSYVLKVEAECPEFKSKKSR